jgi:hypothetical protein
VTLALDLLFAGGCIQGRHIQPGGQTQIRNFLLIEFQPLTDPHVGRDKNIAIAHAFEPTDLDALRFPQATHFAIATLHDHAVKPAIAAPPRAIDDIGEARDAIIQQHTFQQVLLHFVIHIPLHTHQIFPVDDRRRMHQSVGQFTVIGEQQSPCGIAIQPSNRIHPVARCFGNQIDDRLAAFFVTGCGDRVLWFVKQDIYVRLTANFLTPHADPVPGGHFCAKLTYDFTVYTDLARSD